MKTKLKPNIVHKKVQVTYDLSGDYVELTQTNNEDTPIYIRLISSEENIKNDDEKSRDSLRLALNSTDELRTILDDFDSKFNKFVKL